mmetsp:Transcript_6844/g.17506  ORF Transcript_6844/g.17506 Transcript_6844/m.17506 type:complete len:242 (+) Transcript_6844:228-953(+)
MRWLPSPSTCWPSSNQRTARGYGWSCRATAQRWSAFELGSRKTEARCSCASSPRALRESTVSVVYRCTGPHTEWLMVRARASSPTSSTSSPRTFARGRSAPSAPSRRTRCTGRSHTSPTSPWKMHPGSAPISGTWGSGWASARSQPGHSRSLSCRTGQMTSWTRWWQVKSPSPGRPATRCYGRVSVCSPSYSHPHPPSACCSKSTRARTTCQASPLRRSPRHRHGLSRRITTKTTVRVQMR